MKVRDNPVSVVSSSNRPRQKLSSSNEAKSKEARSLEQLSQSAKEHFEKAYELFHLKKYWRAIPDLKAAKQKKISPLHTLYWELFIMS